MCLSDIRPSLQTCRSPSIAQRESLPNAPHKFSDWEIVFRLKTVSGVADLGASERVQGYVRSPALSGPLNRLCLSPKQFILLASS